MQYRNVTESLLGNISSVYPSEKIGYRLIQQEVKARIFLSEEEFPFCCAKIFGRLALTFARHKNETNSF